MAARDERAGIRWLSFCPSMLPRQNALAVVPFLLASLLSLPAAAEPPVDQVNLVSGGFVRGRVMEHDPTSGTSVLLADGSTKHFEASQVASVRMGSEGTPPPAPPPSRDDPKDAPRAPEATSEVARPDLPSEPGSSAFRAHVRAGITGTVGTAILGGNGYGPITAIGYGLAGRIGVQYAEAGALYFEPTLSFATDSTGTVFTTWQQVVAEWTPGHFLLAGGLGLAPTCFPGYYSYCKGDIFGTVVRLGYHSGHEERATPSSGVFVGGEVRTALLGNGVSMIVPAFAIGWEYL
jgi:hypothetical protein